MNRIKIPEKSVIQYQDLDGVMHNKKHEVKCNNITHVGRMIDQNRTDYTSMIGIISNNLNLVLQAVAWYREIYDSLTGGDKGDGLLHVIPECVDKDGYINVEGIGKVHEDNFPIVRQKIHLHEDPTTNIPPEWYKSLSMIYRRVEEYSLDVKRDLRKKSGGAYNADDISEKLMIQAKKLHDTLKMLEKLESITPPREDGDTDN